MEEVIAELRPEGREKIPADIEMEEMCPRNEE